MTKGRQTCTDKLTDVVAPRQIENAGVVFLPVGTEEHEHDADQYVEDAFRPDAVLAATEHRVDADRHHQCRPTVETVVEELAERATGAGTTGLLAVRPVWNIVDTK